MTTGKPLVLFFTLSFFLSLESPFNLGSIPSLRVCVGLFLKKTFEEDFFSLPIRGKTFDVGDFHTNFSFAPFFWVFRGKTKEGLFSIKILGV